MSSTTLERPQDEEQAETAAIQENQITAAELAQRTIAERLRSDMNVQGMYDLLAQQPDIRAEVAEVQDRRDELNTTDMRAYSAELIGLSLSPRGNEILDLTIERSVGERTARVKEALRQGEVHVNDLVVGSGVHSSIYNSVRAEVLPENPALTVEREERIGGQFAQTEEAGWRLNTRTRPEDPELPNLPGTAGSLNSLESAPIQQADLTGDAYGTQKSLADAIRASHLLVSEVINNCEVVTVHKIQGKDKNTYLVQMHDTETDENYTLSTDRIIFTTGLGESRTGLENADAETQQILAEEKEKLVRGEVPQVMTGDEYMRFVGNDANSFPLQGQKTVGVAGPGDAGATVAEFDTGHGPSTRKSVSQLDRVEKVFWFGQKAMSREEFLKTSRERYSEMSLEFPREGAEDYPHRIEPVPYRAIGLRRYEGQIQVIYGDRTGKEAGRAPVDLLVLATGLKDKLDEILKGVSEESLEREPFACAESGENPICRRVQGEEIYIAGPSAQLEVNQTEKDNSPALSRMKVTKTPAIWSYADDTAMLARELAAQDKARGLTSPAPIFEKRTAPIREISAPKEDTPEAHITITIGKETHILPTSANSTDMVQLSVAQKFQRTQWPEDLESLNLEITRTEDSFVIGSKEGLLSDSVCKELVAELFEDKVMHEVTYKLTNPRHNRGQAIDIRIPLHQRQINVGGITMTPARRES